VRYAGPDAVVDACTDPAAVKNAVLAKGGEVLGGAAGVELELGLELSDGSSSVVEEVEDANPQGMAEHPEELG